MWLARIQHTTGQATSFLYQMLVSRLSLGSVKSDRKPTRRRRSVETPEGGKRRGRRFSLLNGGKLFLEEAPRWWLAGLLVFAPWAFGAIMPITKEILTKGLLALIGLFAVSLALRRRWPRIHWLTALLSLFLLGQGWLMTWNPWLVYDPMVFYFHHVQQPIGWLPGTVDHAASFHQMLLITGLFGAFWVAMDAAANPVWRSRLWLVMSLTGVSIMILGLLQRVTGAPAIFWQTDLDCGSTFFATYRYHANAGAFINIVLPLIAGQTLLTLRCGRSGLARALWVLALLFTLVSGFVNVSRAATVITIGSFCLLSLWEIRQRTQSQDIFFTKQRISVVACLLIVGVSLLVWTVGFGNVVQRWLDPYNPIVGNGRVLAYQVVVQHLLGPWGFGPATFQLVFPFFTNSLGNRIEGIWEYAHADYLQTVVEWGLCGALAWFILFGSTIVRAAATFYRSSKGWEGEVRVFAVACFLALGSVLIHALVDFPLQIASLQLYTSVLLGLLTALSYQKTKSSRRIGRRQTFADAREGTFPVAQPNGE
jgi:O-Antigen ligase